MEELRTKEAIVEKEMQKGVDYARGNVSVLELVTRYISLKQNVRYNTKVGYNFVLNISGERHNTYIHLHWKN